MIAVIFGAQLLGLVLSKQSDARADGGVDQHWVHRLGHCHHLHLGRVPARLQGGVSDLLHNCTHILRYFLFVKYLHCLIPLLLPYLHPTVLHP